MPKRSGVMPQDDLERGRKVQPVFRKIRRGIEAFPRFVMSGGAGFEPAVAFAKAGFYTGGH
jgi:hypothetical protein